MDMTTNSGPTCGVSSSKDEGRVLGAGVAGALVSAFLASACCIGPLLAVFLGVTSAGSLLALEPYRPFFVVLMLAFLGFGFYRAYWRPKAAARRGESCCTPQALKLQRIVLWLATLFAAVMFFVPNLLIVFIE